MLIQPDPFRGVKKRFRGECPALEVELFLLIPVTFKHDILVLADTFYFLQGRLKAAYTVLNDHLATRDWVAGDEPTVADFSCCGYLYYPEPFGFVRADWPHNDRWLDRVAALPGWKHPYDLMPGSPADRAGTK